MARFATISTLLPKTNVLALKGVRNSCNQYPPSSPQFPMTTLWFWVTSLPLQPMTDASLACACESWWLQPASQSARPFYRCRLHSCSNYTFLGGTILRCSRAALQSIFMLYNDFFFFFTEQPSFRFLFILVCIGTILYLCVERWALYYFRGTRASCSTYAKKVSLALLCTAAMRAHAAIPVPLWSANVCRKVLALFVHCAFGWHF